MHPIPLRSADPVKRIATQDVAPLLPTLSRLKILDVTAALYFYESWTHLLDSVRPDAAPVLFDQDMSYGALMSRRVHQAQHVERVCSIPLPYAFILVVGASVTRDLRRDFVPYELLRDDNPYEKALSKLDWWRVVSSERGHPLVPAGFLLCRAAHAGDHASNRLSGLEAESGSLRWLEAILPETAFSHAWTQLSPLVYLRREDLIEIEPVPFAEMVSAFYRTQARHVDKLRELGGHRDRDDWPLRIERSKQQYARLAAAARLPENLSRQAAQSLDIDVRDVLGKPWYWPLEPRGDQRALKMWTPQPASAAAQPARKVRGRAHSRKLDGATTAQHVSPLDFRAVLLDGLEVVLEERFADLSPIEQQPLAFQLLERIVGQFELRNAQPSPAEDTFMRRAIELYSAAAFYEACAEGYRAATAGQSMFFDGGVAEVEMGGSLRRALWAATVMLLSVPRAGDVLEAARDLDLDETQKRIFTRGKRYEVLGSLREAWVVDDTGTDNLLDGEYLMNFRIYRRKATINSLHP
ncbi:hypothetical protein [Burkholderia glumae]|uniref:hypothetical protein n=1 Tax=Burkholderia glumae TaxID=337 RepID=UPI002036FD7C|nr:hypothetical protein [Burkholderia glumae]MCM2549258.1 hypothetical protein [Burkholderia glumae]